MKKATVTVLLSALAFPGAGHLYLKHLKRGTLLLAIFSVLFFFIMQFAYQQATMVYQAILAGHIPLTRDGITQFMVENFTNITELKRIGYASYATLFLWLLGILDSYRLAKRELKA